MGWLIVSVKRVKSLNADTFGNEFSREVLTSKYHFVVHIVEDLAGFGGLRALHSSRYEHSNVTIENT